MKPWKMILISSLITLSICSIYLYSVWRHRQDPGAIGNTIATVTTNSDDDVVMRQMFFVYFADTKQLEGTTVWMKNGYTMPYYPYAGGTVEFARRLGLIPEAQRMDVKKIVKQAAPANEHNNVQHGSRQAFAVFALPGQTGLYATPIGFIDGSQEMYYCDLLFYYDDPHTIYDHWSKEVWAAIDAHQVKPGMNETQSRLALGHNLQMSDEKEGDRTVTYDVNGKHWAVTYVKDRATEIKSE